MNWNDRNILKSIDQGIWWIYHMLHAHFGIKAQSLILTITTPGGTFVGQPASLGSAGGQASVQEYTGPNGTGAPEAPAGPIQYASDNPSVATVDPNSGVITSVAPGTANISATDTSNGLTDTVAATVTLTAQSLVLTVTPIAGTPASAAAAKAKIAK